MTIATSNSEALLDRIHTAGYWRVLLHSTVFEEQRVPTLRQCEAIVEQSQVRLRGWAYPHIDRSLGVIQGPDWIQSGADSLDLVEFWRFYQSGQFVHHFAINEDRYPVRTLPQPAEPAGELRSGPRSLHYLNALYTLTEILEFASRLAYRDMFNPEAMLQIELHDTKGRNLHIPEGKWSVSNRQSHTDPIIWQRIEPAVSVIVDAPRLAIDAALYIFERFGWTDPSRAMLEESQRRLLERRL